MVFCNIPYVPLKIEHLLMYYYDLVPKIELFKSGYGTALKKIPKGTGILRAQEDTETNLNLPNCASILLTIGQFSSHEFRDIHRNYEKHRGLDEPSYETLSFQKDFHLEGDA
ncbi:unnamed protein product [Lepeophtheirus salmonis]|uniref:(salmon louse) hypothetical protein n=1 Tax=Lepeophtheirus salmonis TaxID=72036 RepID=A0A7R8CRV9_LEPSM|nr:unnamed protein product [Lepeophtheirus salmonis]CAF2871659.1 unnamed protein product [Lepeophtheirus salmonis]